MIIEKIEIQNVKGLSPLEMKDIPNHGVFRISGENERGKSTIMEALHVFLKYKHSSKDGTVRALQPVGKDDVAPRVSVTMKLGDYHLTMTKQWLKEPSAKLVIDAPVGKKDTLAGDKAEKRFAAILDEQVDTNLRTSLFVRQGEALNAVNVSGIPPLVDALQEDSDFASDSEIVKLARVECEKNLTGKALRTKKNSDLYHAEEQVKECTENYNTARQKEAALEATFQEARKASETRIRIDEKELPKARKLLEERKGEVEKTEELQKQVEGATESASRAARDADHAQEAFDARNALNNDVAQREESVQGFRSALEKLSQQAEKAQLEYQEAHKAYQAAKEAVQEAQAGVDKANELVETAESVEKLAQKHLDILEKREQKARDVEVLEDCEGRVASAQSARPEITVSESQFKEIEKAHLDWEVKSTSLQQSSATMSFTGYGEIEADGKQFTLAGEPVEVTLVNGTVLRIGDVEVTYSSGTQGPTLQEVEAAQSRFRELLAQAGVEDVEKARQAKDETLNAERLVQQYQQQLETVLQKKGTVEAINQQIAELDNELVKAGLSTISVEEGRKILQEAETQHLEAKQDKKRAEKEQRQAEKAREDAEKKEKESSPQKLEEKCIAAERDLKAAEQELESARKKRDEAESKKPHADVERECTQARDKKQKAEEQLQKLRTTLAEAAPQKTREAKDEADKDVKRLEAELAKANAQYERAVARIETAEGVEGECEQAKVEKEAAERYLAAVKARANAARRLVETLEKKQLEVRGRYSEKYRTVIAELAERVFGPNVDFRLNDNLAITARVLDGTPIDLKQLSGGAHEQLDLLTRLAIAKIAGNHVPVFLDDALGSTDAERLKLIGGLLADTGADTQVFVLTCEPQRFDSVPDIHEYPMDKIAPRNEE